MRYYRWPRTRWESESLEGRSLSSSSIGISIPTTNIDTRKTSGRFYTTPGEDSIKDVSSRTLSLLQEPRILSHSLAAIAIPCEPDHYVMVVIVHGGLIPVKKKKRRSTSLIDNCWPRLHHWFTNSQDASSI